MRPIPYTKPSITRLEIDYVADAAANGWGAKCYDYIIRFEESLAALLDARYVIATSSCTGALHMGLRALGVSAGDDVVVPDATWIATAAPVTYLGARPVLADVDSFNWCLTPETIRAHLGPRTSAVIVTHLYGNVASVPDLCSAIEDCGIPLVEDAAEAFGSRLGDRAVGTMGTFGVFSFHGTKTITTGEGGAFVTSDEGLFSEVRDLGNHGRRATEARQFWSDTVGYKYKMSNLQAAMGCAQLERAKEILSRKREIFDFYSAHVGTLGVFEMNPEPEGTTNSYWMPTVVASVSSGISREQLLEAFRSVGIDARVFFWPLSSMPMFADQQGGETARSLSERAVNLPSYYDMTDEDQLRVVSVLRDLADQ